MTEVRNIRAIKKSSLPSREEYALEISFVFDSVDSIIDVYLSEVFIQSFTSAHISIKGKLHKKALQLLRCRRKLVFRRR